MRGVFADAGTVPSGGSHSRASEYSLALDVLLVTARREDWNKMPPAIAVTGCMGLSLRGAHFCESRNTRLRSTILLLPRGAQDENKTPWHRGDRGKGMSLRGSLRSSVYSLALESPLGNREARRARLIFNAVSLNPMQGTVFPGGSLLRASEYSLALDNSLVTARRARRE